MPTIGTKGPRRHDPKTPPAGSADTQVATKPHSHHATTTTKIRNTLTEHAGTTPSTPPRGPRTRRRTLTNLLYHPDKKPREVIMIRGHQQGG